MNGNSKFGKWRWRKRKRTQVLAVLSALALTAGFLGGCGGGETGAVTEDKAVPEEPEAAGEGQTDTRSGEGESKEPVAMGRYVETAVELPDLGRSHGITALVDGRLLILDEAAGQMLSEDGGKTWETVPIPGIDSMSAFTKEEYIYDMAAAPDGTVAVLFTDRSEEGAEPHSQLHVARPDGTVLLMEELPVSADEHYIYNIYYSPEGELFATAVGAGTVYQVDVEKETLTKLLTMEWRPDLIQFQGDYMLFLTHSDGVTIYDRKEEKWLEDDVLSEFMKGSSLGEYYVNDTYTVYLTPGEENVIYIAGKGGMYRHVIGGSAMEQIIDGALSSFSNPSMGIIGITAFGDNEFAALFSVGKVVLYQYDPNVPTVPEDLVTVYSLEEQDAVRQAIAQFQTEHPDIFVKYEIGLSGTDAVSREDAVKKLNTELMAGKGPDVLIMDGLPADSYSDKGILADLKPHIDSLTGEAALLPNIAEAFTEDGRIYMMPVFFAVPMVAGRQADIEGITDYASLADTVERLRKEHPGAEIGRFFCEEAMMRWFLPVAAPAFAGESGGIEEEPLSQYLTLTDRIYTASLEGLPDPLKESYARQKESYKSMDWAYENFDSISQQAVDFLLEDMALAAGMLKDIYGYQEMLSLKYAEGLSDVDIKSFDGMGDGVFVPSVLVGLNAASAHFKEAEQFFDTIMGTQVQSLLYDGFMVNQKALENQLSPQWTVFQNAGMDVGYGEVSSSLGGSTGDGREFHLDIYMPTEEEFAALYGLCSSVHTPYVADPAVEEAVIDIGAQYLQGYLSAEEAVKKILAKVEIYMAE